MLAGSVFGRQKLYAATGAAAGKQASASGKITGFGASDDVYAELGVPTLINAHLTETVIGGSNLRPEAMAFMEKAAENISSS